MKNLSELQTERTKLFESIKDFIEKTYEIAFGDDAINRNFTITDVLDQLKELSDNYPDNHYE